MKLSNKILLILILCAAPIVALAQGGDELKIPDEVKPFVEKGMKAIALESADLNGDGAKDFLLVLDKANVAPEDEYTYESDRPLLILVRGADGKLTLAARNDEVVYCRNCGGVYGDPFDELAALRGGGGFVVRNVGGSSDRWLENYEFKYSRRDKTWQLTSAVSTTYNVFQPKRKKTSVWTPKEFGKINFADFRLEDLQKHPAGRVF